MSRVTTHVLDVVHGRPAIGMRLSLWKDSKLLASVATNADGRSEGPLLEGESLVSGTYELRFNVGEYFSKLGVECPFLEEVPVRFKVEAGKSYHVPLIVSPWAYSTYRGS